MQVRHLVARDNVDAAGWVIDPNAVRHGTLRAARVWALAGPIDAETHLNLDFREHRLDTCVVVESLEVGAPVVAVHSVAREEAVTSGSPATLVGAAGSVYVLARAAGGAHSHLGAIDFGARRAAWLAALQARRAAAAHGAETEPVTR